jgi:hypothetical protein
VLNQNLAGDVFKVDKYSLCQITVPGIFSDEFGNQQRKLNHFLMPDRLRKPRLSLYFSVISLRHGTPDFNEKCLCAVVNRKIGRLGLSMHGVKCLSIQCLTPAAGKIGCTHIPTV